MSGFDAFASGIIYGGLRNMLEIKILVCYLLDKVKEPMTRKQMCDCLQDTGLVNYFDLNTAIDELLSAKMICKVEYLGEPCISVTEAGRKNSKELETVLTHTTRERSVKAALKLLARARAERETTVEIEKTNSGCRVTFIIEALGEEMMKLSLYAGDILQAEQLKEEFLNDPAGVYTVIIDKLTGEI